VKNIPRKEESPMHPLHDAWEGFGQFIVDEPSPTPQVPPVPPDKQSKKDSSTKEPVKIDRKK
jgi:hypothetical protein